MEWAGYGRLGLQWKPRARLAAVTGVREAGGGSRSVGSGAPGAGSGTGSGGAEKGAAFGVRSLEAFPQGKKAIFSHLLSNLLSRAE